MVKLSGLETKLRAVKSQQPNVALYLYDDPAYSTVYDIMGPYKNYPNWLKTTAHKRFNKVIFWLRIGIEYGVVIHQNLWTWNGFHLDLKFRQCITICYIDSVFIATIWTCMQGNQTSIHFHYMSYTVEEYLFLPGKNEELESDSRSKEG